MRSTDYSPFPNAVGRNGLQASIEVPLLIRSLNLPTGVRVLEVGCGRGIALPVLARMLRPKDLAGLDIDAALLTEAHYRMVATGTNARLIHADMRAMPFDDASFDVVLDFGTCYHISHPAVALQEIERVLAPRGIFVHETPVAQHLAHPIRSFGRTLPWELVPALRRKRSALLWSTRVRYSLPPAA